MKDAVTWPSALRVKAATGGGEDAGVGAGAGAGAGAGGAAGGSAEGAGAEPSGVLSRLESSVCRGWPSADQIEGAVERGPSAGAAEATPE